MGKKHKKNRKSNQEISQKFKSEFFDIIESIETPVQYDQIIFTNKGIKFALSPLEKDFLLVAYIFTVAIVLPILTLILNMGFWNFTLPVAFAIYFIWYYINAKTSINYIMDLNQNRLLKEIVFFNRLKFIKKVTELHKIKLLGISSSASDYDEYTKNYVFKYQTIAVYGNKNQKLILEEKKVLKTELNILNSKLELLAQKINCPNFIPTDGESYITIEKIKSSLHIMKLAKFQSTEKHIKEINSPETRIKLYSTCGLVLFTILAGLVTILAYINGHF